MSSGGTPRSDQSWHNEGARRLEFDRETHRLRADVESVAAKVAEIRPKTYNVRESYMYVALTGAVHAAALAHAEECKVPQGTYCGTCRALREALEWQAADRELRDQEIDAAGEQLRAHQAAAAAREVACP